tara:strand:+ start:29 stop:559 length:531 start_codon:yes stop_codon:yes gene_type:complete
MALKSYILTKDFKSPYVTSTGLPHNPQAIRFKQFRKGEVVNGEMKHANNKPAFVLVNGVCVVPLQVIKELVTKEVVSHADGQGKQKGPIKDIINKNVGSAKKNSNPKIAYADALLIGAVVGFGGVILAEKQGWITEQDNKYRLYGAVGVSALAMYFVYRQKTQKKVKTSSSKTLKE